MNSIHRRKNKRLMKRNLPLLDGKLNILTDRYIANLEYLSANDPTGATAQYLEMYSIWMTQGTQALHRYRTGIAQGDTNLHLLQLHEVYLDGVAFD